MVDAGAVVVVVAAAATAIVVEGNGLLRKCGECWKAATTERAFYVSACPNQGCKTSDGLNAQQSASGWLCSSNNDFDRLLVRGPISDLSGKGMPAADVLPKWLVRLLSSCDKILALQDQVKIKRVLFQECLAKVIPSLN